MTFLLVLTFILCTTSIHTSAQLFVNGRNVNVLDSVQVIELTAVNNLIHRVSKNSNWYDVDYGQSTFDDNLFKYQITDSSNNVIKFGNTIQLVNFIISTGWEMLNVVYFYTPPSRGSDGVPYYKYIFKKIKH